MPTLRESPYSAFNFLVELEPGKGKDPQAGFSEVSGLNTEITVAEYRTGNDPVNHVRKQPGIFKTGDVTLKRGVASAFGGGALLAGWIGNSVTVDDVTFDSNTAPSPWPRTTVSSRPPSKSSG